MKNEDEGVKLWHSDKVTKCLDQGPQLRSGAANSQTLNAERWISNTD